MRSRPEVRVEIAPAPIVPGSEIRVSAVLASRSETPVDAVEFSLRATERRYSHTRRTKNSSHRVYKSHAHLSLAAQTGPGTLSVGEHRFHASFPIPASSPPSYRSGVGSMTYELEVRVHIPWWPDRTETYWLDVRPAPVPLAPVPASVHATSAGGPSGEALYLEVSLDPSELVPGGRLLGAVSASNVRFHRLRALDASLVAVDRARFKSSSPEREISRHAYRLVDGAPEEGASIPFALPLPPDVLPSFHGALLEHAWLLEIRAEIAWGSDVLLRVPLFVPARLAEAPSRPPATRVPPVGHARRAAAWEAVAAKHGLEHDRENEVLSTRVSDVSVRIHVEHRGDAGLHSIAELDWPDLGIGLEVRERRWLDALSRRTRLGDPRFDERFLSGAREETQLRSMLRPELREALLAFPEVSADDDLALLAAPGGAFDFALLDGFVAWVRRAARAAADGAAAIPPPALMAAFAPAWAAFAKRLSGRFSPGGMAVEGALVAGMPFSVHTLWDEGGRPSATRVEHRLGAPASSTRASASLEARLRAELPGLEVSAGALRFSAPAPLPDPASLEPGMAALADLARALRGLSPAGPYR